MRSITPKRLDEGALVGDGQAIQTVSGGLVLTFNNSTGLQISNHLALASGKLLSSDAITAQSDKTVLLGGKNSTNTMQLVGLTLNGGPPTSGTWNQGDVILDFDSGITLAQFWACTVAGTPGTWVPIGATTMRGGDEIAAVASGTSGTVTLDCKVASVFTLTPTGNVTTLTISNPPPSGRACTITLIVTQPASFKTIATPTGGIFFGAPTPQQVNSKHCIFTYMTTDGGTTWLCSGVVEV